LVKLAVYILLLRAYPGVSNSVTHRVSQNFAIIWTFADNIVIFASNLLDNALHLIIRNSLNRQKYTESATKRPGGMFAMV
jgi:hypothetical protein